MVLRLLYYDGCDCSHKGGEWEPQPNPEFEAITFYHKKCFVRMRDIVDLTVQLTTTITPMYLNNIIFLKSTF